MTLAEQIALDLRRHRVPSLTPVEEKELQAELRGQEEIDSGHHPAAQMRREYGWAMERALPHDREDIDKVAIEGFIREHGFRAAVDALCGVSPAAKRLSAMYPKRRSP